MPKMGLKYLGPGRFRNFRIDGKQANIGLGRVLIRFLNVLRASTASFELEFLENQLMVSYAVVDNHL